MAEHPQISTPSAATQAAADGRKMRDEYPDPDARKGPDESTVRAVLDALTPRSDHPVGNLADLQRLGALVAEGRSNDPADAVLEPPSGVDTDRLPGKAAEQHENLVQGVVESLGIEPSDDPVPAEVNVPVVDTRPAKASGAPRKAADS